MPGMPGGSRRQDARTLQGGRGAGLQAACPSAEVPLKVNGTLEADVRRTILLGAYMQAWGMPRDRTVSRRASDVIEVYEFPAGVAKVCRYATVGLSGIEQEDGGPSNCEMMLSLPSDNGGASSRQVVNFLLDLAAYALRADVRLREGFVVGETPLAPTQWPTRYLLIDEPRGEPESLTEIPVGTDQVKLWWVVPIYASEYELIRSQGLGAFDDVYSSSEWSLADPGRPPFI